MESSGELRYLGSSTDPTCKSLLSFRGCSGVWYERVSVLSTRLWTARERFHPESPPRFPVMRKPLRSSFHPQTYALSRRIAARSRRIFAASRADSRMMPDFLLGAAPRKSAADVERCSGSCRDQQGRQICLRTGVVRQKALGSQQPLAWRRSQEMRHCLEALCLWRIADCGK